MKPQVTLKKKLNLVPSGEKALALCPEGNSVMVFLFYGMGPESKFEI